MVNLDYLTLGVSIGIMSLIVFVIMLIHHKINTYEKGLNFYVIGALFASLAFLALMFEPSLGSYSVFLNHLFSLIGPILLLEGTLRFKGYGSSSLRNKIMFGTFLLVAVVTFLDRENTAVRYFFYDFISIIVFTLNGIALLLRTTKEDRKYYMFPTAMFILPVIGFIIRISFVLRGAFATDNPYHPAVTFVFLTGLIWTVSWAFSLSIIMNLRSQQRIAKLTNEDYLTGLYNRKNFNETLEDFIEQGLQDNSSFVLFMIDINGFKHINDNYGHDIGDDVLVALAKNLKEKILPRLYVARYAGDEFVIICKSQDNVDSELKVSKIRNIIEDNYKISDLTVQLRTSIGYAEFPKDGTNSGKLFEVADQNMFREKTMQREMTKVIKKV